MFFDPMYFVFLAPAILLALWAQGRVKLAYEQARVVAPRSGVTGAEAAMAILRRSGIPGVGIEPVGGHLSDHYDPRTKVLRLSADVYQGRSLAALGIAAHEAGHALQDASGYPLLSIRNAIVPLAATGGSLSWVLLGIGLLLGSMKLFWLGIVLFSLTVVFQIVNLPVEFDASRRAKTLLRDLGLVSSDEEPLVKRVLGAAAMTYVAATVSSLLTLAYYLFRAGVLGGSSRDEA